RIDFGCDQVGNEARAAAAEARRHGDVLLAVDLEAHGETLHRRREPRAPEDAHVAHVDGFELAIEIADERDAAGRRQHPGQERRALLDRPFLFQRVDVESREPADVAVAARHFIEAPIGAARAAAARRLRDRLRANRDAALRERNDQPPRRPIEAHRLPVLAAFGARTALDPFADFLIENVVAIARRARLAIEARPDVLEQRLDVAEIGAVAAVVLPEHAVFTRREHPLLVAGVDEHALEHDVEIERLARRMRVMPLELAGGRVERDRRVRVEADVARAHAAAHGHPRLRLRDAPVREIELRIVAAGDPGLAAGAIQVRQIAPRIAAGLAVERDRQEAPALLAGIGIVGADEALVLFVALATAHAFEDEPVRGERAAAARAAALHRPVPLELAGASVQSDEPSAALEDQLVLIQRDAARRDRRVDA